MNYKDGDDMSDSCTILFNGEKSENYPLTPISTGEEKCTPGHFWGAGIRPYYIIHYVISGTGVFYCGTDKHVVKAGQMFVIFPNTIVKYQADNNNPWHYTWVLFSGNEAKSILEYAGITYKKPIVEVNDSRILDIFRTMPQEKGISPYDDLRFTALLYEFMSLLVNIDKEDKGQSVYVTDVKNYVNAHYPETITVEKIASYIGIDRKYLYAVFKEATGISPKDYIVDYRIKKACELLKDKNLSIENVSFSVGYKDPLAFSKMFKSKIGVSPTEYRKQI